MYRTRLCPTFTRAGLWLMLAMLLAATFALSSADPASALQRLAQCGNHIDDDGDLKVDFPADPGCTRRGDTTEAGAVTQCSDGNDNDGNIVFDYPNDPGCASASDVSEAAPAVAPPCTDGLDNDPIPGDGKIDYPSDPGCISASDASETDTACSDGVDNDFDTFIDFPFDWGCSAPVIAGPAPDFAPDQPDNAEEDPPQCNDGIDNDGDGWLDANTNIPGQTKDPGCTGPNDPTESPNPPVCSDGMDNDNDGKIDYPADPGCTSADDTDETDPPPAPDPTPSPTSYACSDGVDNDKDGLTDFPNDAGCASRTDNDETNPPPTAGVSFDSTGPKAPAGAPVVTGPKGAPSTIRPLISPFPIVRLRGRADRSGVFITLLRVQAPKGSKVTVFCKGKSCPLRWKSVITTTGIVRSHPFERRLRVGTTLTIYVTKAGFTGKYTRFKIRKKKPPTRIDRCARSMGGPPVSCASN
ncbi:MAG: hypothetical protein QOK16_3623 [Solirubrobacteraceae bacterium]|nr:hypothetical protein [Solirubrobacteraceae bacterium]